MLKKLKNILLLQGVVIIYTISSIMSKNASANRDDFMRFLFFFGMEFVVLGIYAMLWQQIIKRFELSIAYANRSMAILWSLIWTVAFFRETLTLKNIAGVLIVFAGTMIVNSDGE